MHTLVLGKLTSRLAVWMIKNEIDQRGNTVWGEPTAQQNISFVNQ